MACTLIYDVITSDTNATNVRRTYSAGAFTARCVSTLTCASAVRDQDCIHAIIPATTPAPGHLLSKVGIDHVSYVRLYIVFDVDLAMTRLLFNLVYFRH